MSLEIPDFTTMGNWENPEEFPVVVDNENQARKNMQRNFTAISEYINGTLLRLLSDALSTHDVVNRLDSVVTDKPLSAAQGKALKDSADALAKKVPKNALGKADVVNRLDSGETDKPLSAAQGKVLNTAIESLARNVSKINVFNYRATGKYPAEYELGDSFDGAIMSGWASGGKRALSIVFGGDCLTFVDGSGLTADYTTRLTGTKINLAKDPGGAIAGAHNSAGNYEKIIAFREELSE